MEGKKKLITRSVKEIKRHVITQRILEKEARVILENGRVERVSRGKKDRELFEKMDKREIQTDRQRKRTSEGEREREGEGKRERERERGRDE